MESVEIAEATTKEENHVTKEKLGAFWTIAIGRKSYRPQYRSY